MDSRIALLGSGIALGLFAVGCGGNEGIDLEPDGSCNAAALQEELDAAKPGETVTMGICEVAGTLTVPAGVRLRGQGRASSSVTAPEGGPAVVLVPGGPGIPTALLDVSVSSADGTAGVLAQGAGEVELIQVDVSAQKGIAVGAESLSNLRLSGVTLLGPLRDDPGAATLWSDDEQAIPANVATHGLVLVDVQRAQLDGVSTEGFVRFGALLVRSTVEAWAGGMVSGNAGVGMMVVGGEATVSDVEISGTVPGKSSLPAYGGLFVSEEAVTQDTALETAGATVTLSSVTVRDNMGVGLLYADGRSFTMAGEQAPDGQDPPELILGNVFGGLVVVDSSNVSVSDVMVTTTKQGTLPLGPQDAMIDGGDGVRLVRSTEGIAFERVRMTRNERAGLLLDLEDADSYASLADSWRGVNVHGNEQNGALCLAAGQMMAPGTGWDIDINRGDAATELSDQSATNPLAAVGVVGPCNMPAPASVLENGLRAILTAGP